MLGKPRFKREDLVTFNFNIEGEIQKIDGGDIYRRCIWNI